MDHRDAYISDIVVILKPEFADQMDQIVEKLNSAGVGISNVNQDVGAVEGSCESDKVHVIQQFEFVDAVRTTFSYIADYPPGDPRDLDGKEAE